MANLPTLGGSSNSLPTTLGYTPPPAPQPYLPNVNWGKATTTIPTRDDINSVATKPDDQQLQVAAENAPIREIYGRTRVGAQIADVLTYQGKLIIVAVWCGGEIDAIESFEINDKAVPAGVTITSYSGTAAQVVNATLVSAYASHGITFTDRFPNIAYSVFQVPSGTTDGFPQIAAVIRGRKVYDPRTTLTTYSNNPALCLADFLDSSVYGMDRSIDWASVTTVANLCDALVGSEKRRLIGLVIDTPSTCASWVEALRTYASCMLSQEGGYIHLIPDAIAASSATFTASNIVANSLSLKKRGIQQIPTLIDVRYTDTSITPWSEKSAVAKLAGVDAGTTPRRESQISLPGIHRYSQAYREAIERLNKLNLSDLLVDFTAFDEAIKVQVGDVITVSHPIGLSNKLLRVTSVTSDSPGRWRISSAEYDPAAYSDIVQAEPTFTDTALPNPAAPPALLGLVTTEEVYQLDNGTYSSRIRAVWTPADYAYLSHYRVEIYQSGVLMQTATAMSATYASPSMQEGLEYVVKVAAVTAIGAVGAWAQANITVQGKYLIPGNVPSVQVFEAGGRVYVSWGAAIDLDIWRYEVRYGPTAGTWDDATLIDRVDALRLTSDQIPVGTWKIWVKALDSVGQYSATAATANVTVTSDAAAFFVDSYESDTPTLTNMAEFNLGPTDPNCYFVTEDGVAFGTKFNAAVVAGDGNWNDVVLAMHMNGANNSTVFTDVKSHTATAYGNAKISTVQSKFGGASAYFDGSGDYIVVDNSTDWDFGSGDFTVELWVYLTSTATNNCLVNRWNGSGGRSFQLVHEAGKLAFYISTNGSTYTLVFNETSGISASTWAHLAFDRYGAVCAGYVNGTLIGTASMSGITIYAHPTQPITIGGCSSGGGVGGDYGSVNGYIDDLRITKGVARYAGTSFSAPTATFYDVANSGGLSSYAAPLATYHSSLTSTWLGEPEDFGQLLGGQWTGSALVAALSGSMASYMGFATVGSAPGDFSFIAGLSHKENARFAKLKHESLTTSTLHVTVPGQSIRLDAIPREEVGTGTSSAAGPVTITLENDYISVKKLTITPEGATARSATYDNIVLGSPTTFDVYIFNDSGVKIASPFRFEFQGV